MWHLKKTSRKGTKIYNMYIFSPFQFTENQKAFYLVIPSLIALVQQFHLIGGAGTKLFTLGDSHSYF
jgi:hypothetical protein